MATGDCIKFDSHRLRGVSDKTVGGIKWSNCILWFGRGVFYCKLVSQIRHLQSSLHYLKQLWNRKAKRMSFPLRKRLRPFEKKSFTWNSPTISNETMWLFPINPQTTLLGLCGPRNILTMAQEVIIGIPEPTLHLIPPALDIFWVIFFCFSGLQRPRWR